MIVQCKDLDTKTIIYFNTKEISFLATSLQPLFMAKLGHSILQSPKNVNFVLLKDGQHIFVDDNQFDNLLHIMRDEDGSAIMDLDKNKETRKN